MAQLDVAILILDKVFQLVSIGMKYEEVYQEIKDRAARGDSDSQITAYLDNLVAETENAAQNAIDAARRESD